MERKTRLPLVLLLLDVWPFGRLDLGPGRRPGVCRRVAEKVPLLALSAGSCVMTVWAQSSGGAVRSLEVYPLGTRVATALVAYVAYMGKMVAQVAVRDGGRRRRWPRCPR